MPAPDDRCSAPSPFALAGTRAGFRAAARLRSLAVLVPAVALDVDLAERDMTDGAVRGPAAEAVGESAWWLTADALARTQFIPRSLGGRTDADHPALLVLPIPVDLDLRTSLLSGTAKRFLDALAASGSTAKPVLGLRSGHLIGGRRHLADLGVLRRVCEEWGLGVAIDATKVAETGWEAEAAVARLGGTLHLLRIGTRSANSHAAGGDRLARRALLAATDAPHDVQISLLPQPGLLWRFHQDRAAEAWCASAAWISDHHAATRASRRDIDGRRTIWRPSQTEKDSV